MLEEIKMNRYIPTYVYLSIYDIDFNKLYASGKRIIISDLDNTLLPYHYEKATDDLIKWKEELTKMGFKFYIITNNNDKRIKRLLPSFNIDGYLVKAKKPSPKRLLNYLDELNIKKEETVFLGDQLVTDILCAIKKNTCAINFWGNISLQKQLRTYIINVLLRNPLFSSIPSVFSNRKNIAQKIMELAYCHYGRNES